MEEKPDVEVLQDPNAEPEMTQEDIDRAIVAFVTRHTDAWRDYRDQNYQDDWAKYERIWRGKWSEADKTKGSERSRVVSPATQQAIETRHAEIMEAIFGQDEFFDIEDDLGDKSPLDIEKIKNHLKEDFAQDKIRRAISQIVLMGEIYGTGIGEIVVGTEKQYVPMTVPIDNGLAAYGTGEKERVYVRLVPVNPRNFLFDPNGTCVEECMGVAIEKYVGMHRVQERIKNGEYRKTADLTSLYEGDTLEPTQEKTHFQDDKVKLLTYYGLLPRNLLEYGVVRLFDDDDPEAYGDMVEAIVVIGNDSVLLKAVESPYMMKDRPVVLYQADTMPNRLLGRGTAEKALNMQVSVDGSIRAHMDALALTVAPMVAMDASRLPRGSKFEVKAGGALYTNGPPGDVVLPFKFGTNDGQAIETAKEFERMLLMATGTVDSNGMVTQAARDANGLDMATATIIKKYKRTLMDIQEEFLIPFIKKAAWRYMQFAPERYPPTDVKFVPTAMLGIIAREYEQKQLAFLIQTLGADSPLAPILMQSILKNSSLTNREEMLQQLRQFSQPDEARAMLMSLEAQARQAEANLKIAQAEKARVEAELAPEEVRAKIIAALANNLDDDQEGRDFERRARIAELMLKERDIDSNERIAKMQLLKETTDKMRETEFLREAQNA